MTILESALEKGLQKGIEAREQADDIRASSEQNAGPGPRGEKDIPAEGSGHGDPHFKLSHFWYD
jgi:hypothetical protein